MDLFNQFIHPNIYECKDNNYSEKILSDNFTNFIGQKNYMDEGEIYQCQSFNLIDFHNCNLEKPTNVTNYKTNELFKVDNKVPLSYLEDNINSNISCLLRKE